jgi:Flp pilus assembly CpaF family ATPase
MTANLERKQDSIACPETAESCELVGFRCATRRRDEEDKLMASEMIDYTTRTTLKIGRILIRLFDVVHAVSGGTSSSSSTLLSATCPRASPSSR